MRDERETDMQIETAARTMAKWFDGSDKDYRSFVSVASHVVFALQRITSSNTAHATSRDTAG